MREQAVGRGAVPVHRVGRDVDRIARLQRLRLLPLEADAADAAEAIERLPNRVRVPGGAGARGERDNRPAEPRRRVGGDDRILKHDPGEGLGGALPRLTLPGANYPGFYWHGFSPFDRLGADSMPENMRRGRTGQPPVRPRQRSVPEGAARRPWPAVSLRRDDGAAPAASSDVVR